MNNDGILGIKNRTENWKTARYFVPFFADEAARLRLARKLGAPEETKRGEVHIELFWKGIRDHLHCQAKQEKRAYKDYFPELANHYTKNFGGLLEKINGFPPGSLKFKEPKPRNYNVSHEDFKNGLGNNLVNTEIDIVLETPHHLFIGEAKEEARLDGAGDLVLVHQLIRQYVMAKILMEVRCSRGLCRNKEIVPFLVGDKKRLDNLKNALQVKFMMEKYGLMERNVLSRECVAAIAEGKETCCK